MVRLSAAGHVVQEAIESGLHLVRIALEVFGYDTETVRAGSRRPAMRNIAGLRAPGSKGQAAAVTSTITRRSQRMAGSSLFSLRQ